MKSILTILAAGFLITGITNPSGKNNSETNLTNKIIRADSSLYERNIEPILVKNCSPCHFPGGKMYEKLPFDNPLSIVSVKKERVLMRLKNETEKETIQSYIEQNQ
jgi:hypothetical protein